MKFLLAVLSILFACSANAQSDSLAWERNCDTGRNVSFLSDFEKEVLKELNMARTDPGRYAILYIEPMQKQFKGKLNMATRIETREGVAAVKEAVRVLKKAKPLSLLSPNAALTTTAQYHTSRQSVTNKVGHTSPDGKTFTDRVKNIGMSTAAECISYGESKARGVVTALLIDDGVSDRGHRKTIFRGDLSLAGLSAGKHLQYRTMCTIDFGTLAGTNPASRRR